MRKTTQRETERIVRATLARVSQSAGGSAPAPTPGVSTYNGRSGAVVELATDVPTFIASGPTHTPGGVPDPGAVAGTTKFLREDASWQVPPGTGGAGAVNYSRSLMLMGG